jgi:oligosaccharide repeat unit polymerase
MTTALRADPVEPASSTGPGAPRNRGGVWWLSPVTVTLLIVPVAVLSSLLIDDAGFRREWRTPKTITFETCLLLLCGGLVLALGAAVVASVRRPAPRAGRWPDLSAAEQRLLGRAGTVCFVLTLVGYASFVFAGARAGVGLDQIAATLGGGGVYDSHIKEQIGTIPGLTTLTQVGIASVVVSSLLLAQQRSRTQLVRIAVVIGLAIPRAFLLTERLAILELVVPVIVVLAMRASGTASGRRRVAAVPLVFAPLVAAIFAAFEYSRSWVFFRQTSDSSFLRFALERLIGYYATSLNNGALELAYNRYPGRLPYEIAGAFWTAPGIDNAQLYQRLTGHDNPAFYKQILEQHGTPEFNNSSGLAAPFVDLGPAGGLVYLLVAGVVIGLLHRAFLETRAVGLLIYPVIFLGVVELPRYLAWSQGRVFPTFVVLIGLAVLMRRHAARHPTGAEPSP